MEEAVAESASLETTTEMNFSIESSRPNQPQDGKVERAVRGALPLQDRVSVVLNGVIDPPIKKSGYGGHLLPNRAWVRMMVIFFGRKNLMLYLRR
ncbi:hypothetical protein HAX54_050018 [Datura stramonium]|uniref:Uncharacterized protein n=1 Tax=Datura stramonium TaxID=4076 RepID=A0ABS8SXF7_DATST|nr:hypothetical protein [Datura stramonium]